MVSQGIVLFSLNCLFWPSLDHEENMTAALVVTFLVTHGRYKKAVQCEVVTGFERRPLGLSEVLDLVH